MKLRGTATLAIALGAVATAGCVPTFGFEEGDITGAAGADAGQDVDASLDGAGEADASIDAPDDVSESSADAAGDVDAGDADASPDADACVSTCTAGQASCIGADIARCALQAGGCYAFGAAEACPTNQTCSGNQCILACSDSCSVGQKRCSGGGPQSCDLQTSGCYGWTPGAACTGGQTCSGGACVGACSNVCTLGATRCSGALVQACESQPNGCTDWGATTACSAATCVGATATTYACAGAGACASQTTACPYACVSGACTGVCVPGAKQCKAGATTVGQVCDSSGQWVDSACPSNSACTGGSCLATPLSCAAGGDGLSNCGPGGNQSCCTSLTVPGGTVQLDSTHTATVSDYKLDKYEITVGRFRKFVDAVVAGWTPTAGSGKHTHLNGGSGLSNGSGGYEPGWDVAWNTNLAGTTAAWDSNLLCSAPYQTWTSAAGANERRPTSCSNWYQTEAFCIWDGGFLPSEAEWQYAAAGGSESRTYPWGTTAPGANASLAVYGCYWGGSGSCTGVANIAPVGSVAAGNSKWGQSDLAGNVWEWTLDWYVSPYANAASTNYANVAAGTTRALRGGAYDYPASGLLPAYRAAPGPTSRISRYGARCARVP